MHLSTPVPPSVDISPGQLIEIATSLVNNVQSAKKRLLDATTIRDATFDDVIWALADIENELKGKVQFLALFQAVSPSPKLRHESSVVVKMLDKAYLELFQDENLFELVDSVYKSCGNAKLDTEHKKFVDSLYSTFLDNGLGLDKTDKKMFYDISKRLVELRVAFTENLNMNPGYLAVLSKCVKPETREEAFIQSQRIFPENIALFQEIIVLRDEGARLLGFKSYAHQQARHKLLKSPESVKSMLDELSSYLRPVAKAELEELQRIKGTPETPFYLWDFDYYHRKMLQDNYLVDYDLISEYFPANATVRRMLNAFERILSLKIEKVQNIRDKNIWHPDVKVFAVQDMASSDFIGFLYTDIYQREGKYSHAANFNIFPAILCFGDTTLEKPADHSQFVHVDFESSEHLCRDWSFLSTQFWDSSIDFIWGTEMPMTVFENVDAARGNPRGPILSDEEMA
ncbi:thimet oligopeptidase [Paecilomyces variotii No. 5]|uniref:Thimet oligopeptidase n=1 Tax=Byssochlamys spectabilis (strain No. 5 / NBRC 109023) TaxID=1356009 RepID=V5GA07_BYSSN|nr:thimet oligopeptidase [Paecilomyces variotii No. 5]